MSETTEKTETTALVVVPAASLPTIVANDKDDILGKIARKVSAFKPDISTEGGRGEMRSLAYDIRRSKAELVRIGKGLTEGWRKSTKAVNEECNIIEERMDALAEKVRAPLTDWENAEKVRVKAHEDALATLREIATVLPGETSSQIRAREQRLGDIFRAHGDWQEFRDRAHEAMALHDEMLHGALATAEKAEADARELERLRAEEAERQRVEQERLQREREERIAAQAAEKARMEAERIAAEQAAAAERKAREERDRIEAAARAEAEAAEQRRIALERKAREDSIAAERREREAQERAEAAERARVAAEAKAKADAEEAARKVEADRVAAAKDAERRERDAVEAEKRRTAEAQAKEHAERQKREANKAHRTKINREALAALILLNLTEEQGIAVITAIAKGEVPHCTISY